MPNARHAHYVLASAGAIWPGQRDDWASTASGGICRRPPLGVEALGAMIRCGKYVTSNWLQVLGTTETPHIDQGVRHQFHPVVALLDGPNLARPQNVANETLSSCPNWAGVHTDSPLCSFDHAVRPDSNAFGLDRTSDTVLSFWL